MFNNFIKEFIPKAAKAVAMFVAPWVILVVSYLADRIGIDMPVQYDQVELYLSLALVSIFQSGWTYWQKNREPTIE